MQTHLRSRTWFRPSNTASFVVRTFLLTVLGLFCLVAFFSARAGWVNAQARNTCARTVANGEVLSNDLSASNSSYTQPTPCLSNQPARNSAGSYGEEVVQTHDLGIRTDKATQTAVSGQTTSSLRPLVLKSGSAAVKTLSAISPVVAGGNYNSFPYGQCTWWADQRFHQLHGVFVPWHTNANAWQWTARAAEAGWRVSGAPRTGDIIVLQPGVQGAYWAGHVGVVEQVLPNGRVVASSMNWGANPGAVSYTQFSPGAGVAFVGL